MIATHIHCKQITVTILAVVQLLTCSEANSQKSFSAKHDRVIPAKYSSLSSKNESRSFFLLGFSIDDFVVLKIFFADNREVFVGAIFQFGHSHIMLDDTLQYQTSGSL